MADDARLAPGAMASPGASRTGCAGTILSGIQRQPLRLHGAQDAEYPILPRVHGGIEAREASSPVQHLYQDRGYGWRNVERKHWARFPAPLRPLPGLSAEYPS